MPLIFHKIVKSFRRLKRALINRAYISKQRENDIVSRFITLYFDAAQFGNTWQTTKWLNVRIHKPPTDLWIYQELIAEYRPDVIIEAGTQRGGSAFFFASICELIGHGRVYTIDIKIKNDHRPQHKRLNYMHGSSTSEEIVSAFKAVVKSEETVLVILDSRHHKYHVDEEMRIYSDFVKVGGYMVVEDTILNGHPVNPGFGDGPMESVNEFIKKDNRFEIDRSLERHYLTFNRRGYLKRAR